MQSLVEVSRKGEKDFEDQYTNTTRPVYRIGKLYHRDTVGLLVKKTAVSMVDMLIS
jgi:hypothetical protein